MAGRRANIAHYVTDETRAQTLRALYPEELKAGRDLVGNYYPTAIKNIIKLAEGFTYTTINRKGDDIQVEVPPCLQANTFLVTMVSGVPRQEADPILDRLNEARAAQIEKQTEVLIAVQVRELLARALQREKEATMWEKQYVTEEEEREHIVAAVEAAFRKLMSTTPEDYLRVTEGKDPGSALEAFKGHIGVSVADVLEEVMGQGSDAEPDDDEENEEVDDA